MSAITASAWTQDLTLIFASLKQAAQTFFFSFFFFSYLDSVSLCTLTVLELTTPDWPHTHRDLPVSAS